MLRIITWEEHFKPSDQYIDTMKWDVKHGGPGTEHPTSYLAMAQHLVKVAAKYTDELTLVMTINRMYFDALRVALKENWSANEVFCYGPDSDGKMECTITHIDKDGRMDYWPACMNIWGDLLRRLL